MRMLLSTLAFGALAFAGCKKDHPQCEAYVDLATRCDAELEKCVDPQWMMPGIDAPRQQQAAETHPAHEDAEQNRQRDGGRAD